MSDARFVSFVRQGLGALGPAAAPISVGMHVQGEPASAEVTLYGPGDVAGLDPAQILRREPAPNSSTFPPNHLPYVELRRPDFPWRLSPDAADAQQRVAPWLCLAVLEDDGTRAPRPRAGARLPVVEAAARELPPLAELHAFAHVHISGPIAPGETIEAILRDQPARAVARVLSPRRLDPNRRYLACLVPATEAGRLAGLGQAVQAGDEHVPAWTPGAATVALPVYDAWSFQTGEPGDFETLASRLRPRDLAPSLEPWALGLAEVAGTAAPATVPFPSALTAREPYAWSGPSRVAASTQLEAWLAPASTAQAPRVGPPLYGATQALPATGAVDVPPRLPAAAGWMRDLNLDPRARAAANLGATLVRVHQEEWVAEVSRQLGDAVAANRLISGAAFARAVGQRAHEKHLASRAPAAVVAMAWPAARRLRTQGQSVAANVGASRVGASVLAGAYQRLGRVRAGRASAGAAIDRLNARPSALPAATLLGARAVTQRTVAAQLPNAGHGPAAAVAVAASAALPEPVRLIRADLGAFGQAAVREEPTIAPRPLAVATLAAEIVASFAPAMAAPARLRARFSRGAALPAVDTLRPVVAAPEIATPLADCLVALEPRYLVPNVGALPPDSVGYLRADAAFIEALVVGANHELARELRWRRMPVDVRTTVLRQFWPRDGVADRFSGRDVAALADWPEGARLGSAGLEAASMPGTIVVVRGELVRRFPDALCYCERAIADGPSRKPSTAPTDVVAPLFRGRLFDDAIYLGFADDPATLRGDDGGRGWYFVLQEHPGAARFGFDEFAAPAYSTWMDLAWAGVAVVDGHIALAPAPAAPAATGELVWGADAAQTAAIARRRTARLAIHCKDLLP